ncbi:Fc receptor-like B [Gouania willdenowi]|uniref:Fc receptor-like B n=1 Tax=Gouania willdenowi TaxID=441366 RepID=UPI0010545FE8|nr:Fc receptor-like B [Gouania willdenowi]
MDMLVGVLALSILPGLVATEGDDILFGATVEIVPNLSRKFPGESFQLRCHILDEDNEFDWHYIWFNETGRLNPTEKELNLLNVKVGDGGNYSCQGVTNPLMGKMYSMKSPPTEIFVDGGQAILQVPPNKCLVGETVTLTCRIRNKHPVHEFILFKDGIEVNRKNGVEPYFNLPNVTLNDQGMYSCRASWDSKISTHSVVSAATSLKILEVMTQPILVINDSRVFEDRVMLTCHVQYNAHVPAPPIHFYFYRDSERLGPAKSQGSYFANRLSGKYSCRAKVPQLGLTKWSEPQQFVKRRTKG